MHPMSYLTGSGAQTAHVLPLLHFTLGLSIAVCVIIAAMVVWAIVTRGHGSGRVTMAGVPVERTEGGVRWIWIGVAISSVFLVVTLLWTVAVLAKVAPLPANAPLTIDVKASQWWWDARYQGATSSDIFHTANEIHVPVGRKVLLNLTSGDVIHSFWVPKIAGKMDVIPGQTNKVWIEADRPGRYRGTCGEFCGFDHAKMQLVLVADQPADFERWRQRQLLPAAAPRTMDQARGLALFEYRCGLCHAVRGTAAGAHAAPDLTHLMSRETIAAGVLPNNPATLSGWIENPQNVKPGALMPNQALSGPQLADLRAYLETLQ
jgi:cytochrome c oxidase subunit 2